MRFGYVSRTATASVGEGYVHVMSPDAVPQPGVWCFPSKAILNVLKLQISRAAEGAGSSVKGVHGVA